jgi:deoxycytidylate deaminase
MTAGANDERDKAIEEARRPELVFGLIGALGAEIGAVEGYLRDRLGQLKYDVPDPIKLTDLLRELKGPKFDKLRKGDPRSSIADKMDAGNELRIVTQRGEAMAMLGVNRIRAYRAERGIPEDRAAKATAFILNSLKHPTEVKALRKIYGSAFVAIAVFNERSERIKATQARLAEGHGRGELSDYESEAVKLVQRDQDEQRNSYGQHVSEAFALADVVVGRWGARDLKQSTERFVDAFFGNWTHTPTIDESGMYYAQGARYRSASMARQVGAAILRPADGTIVAIGANDVPKAGGGLYGESDSPDGRDHARTEHKDSSDFYKREVVIDLLEHLLGMKLLKKRTQADILPLVDDMFKTKALRHTKLMGTIDYVRAVHAEAAALMDAARHGVAVQHCTLYTTTFPCHDCTKHIVAAGIERVVFIEPYTKSLTSQLFSDSVAIDESATGGKVDFTPFMGVLPRRYADIFGMHSDRKSEDGMWKEWRPQDAYPVLGDYVAPPEARIITENFEVGHFNKILKAKGLIA